MLSCLLSRTRIFDKLQNKIWMPSEKQKTKREGERKGTKGLKFHIQDNVTKKSIRSGRNNHGNSHAEVIPVSPRITERKKSEKAKPHGPRNRAHTGQVSARDSEAAESICCWFVRTDAVVGTRIGDLMDSSVSRRSTGTAPPEEERKKRDGAEWSGGSDRSVIAFGAGLQVLDRSTFYRCSAGSHGLTKERNVHQADSY